MMDYLQKKMAITEVTQHLRPFTSNRRVVVLSPSTAKFPLLNMFVTIRPLSNALHFK